MASIVTRTGKGSALTVPEMDQNFKNLDAQLLKTDLRPLSAPVFRNDIVNSGVLDSRVTFSRNSTATYFDKFGVLKTAKAGEPRIDYDPITGECRGLLVEPAATNLLTYSEQFNLWGGDGAVVIPDAEYPIRQQALTADKVYINYTGGGGNRRILSPSTVSLTAGTYYTLSLYVKPAGYTSINVMVYGWAGGANTMVSDLIPLTDKYSNGTSRVDDQGNGWFRIQTTALCTSSSPNYYVWLGFSGNSDGTSGAYFWGAQLEAGSTATSYIPTVAAQVTRAADVVKIPQSFTNAKLKNTSTVQIEAKSAALATGQSYSSIKSDAAPINQKLTKQTQAKNLLTNSEKFDASPWTVSAVTVSSSTTINPLTETLTVKKIADTTGNSIHFLYYNVTSGLTIAKPYTYSVYAKAAGRDYFALRWNGDTSQDAVFNLTTGAVVSVDSAIQATMRNIGNGWYRCSITVRPTSVSSRIDLITSANSALTAYAGDGSSGTLIFGAQLEAEEKATKYVPEPAYAIQLDAIQPTQLFNDQTEINKFDRFAITTDGANVSYASNGKYVGSTTRTITQINDIVIGADDTETNQINGHIQKIAVYNTAATQDQLIALSYL